MMSKKRCFGLWVFVWIPTFHHAEEVSFNRDVRPILAENCFSCHGVDATHRKADLRLDVAEGAHAVLTPGKPEESEFWLRLISQDPDELMPPSDSHKQLTEAQKETLKQWILQGAAYERHWAFERILEPAVPELEGSQCLGALDVFVRKELKQKGIPWAEEADKNTLIRRVTLALTGLPPTLEEVNDFLWDSSPQAYDRLVDRLLKSPRFGEHMAHWWLDLARYGDTHGLHLDNERHMWLYRDWVVKAFNENLPFDQFTRDQIAGDLIPEGSLDQKLASGFNRCNVTTGEGGAINEEFLYRYAVDRTSATFQTWMALTVQCAACHDHKFDPISQKEFYQLYAFFNNAADPAMDGNSLKTAPTLKYAHAPEVEKLDQLSKEMTRAQEALDQKKSELLASYRDPKALPDDSPEVQVIQFQEVWMEDAFPEGANVKSDPPATGIQLSEASILDEVKPFSGEKSLKRTSEGLGQIYYTSPNPNFTVPPSGSFKVAVMVDAKNPPKSIMVQFHGPQGWKHRAIWGDHTLIPYGQIDTTERYAAGPLPEGNLWVELEVPFEKVGLKGGEAINGYAFTQFDGTVIWDKLQVHGTDDPRTNPAKSFLAWVELNHNGQPPNSDRRIQDLLKQKPEALNEETRKELERFWIQHVSIQHRDLLKPYVQKFEEASRIRREFDESIPTSFVMGELNPPRQSFVMLRGAYDQPGEPVTPGTPQVFPELKPKEGQTRLTRLELADWMLSPENPLTARVAVNRFWQHFFGTGLVRTSSDFGVQGEMPSHPELLDWLANDFRKNGWDMKRLIRQIVLSHTWKQSSQFRPQVHEQDPSNRWLARGPRMRLNAEAIRDQALFVSGLLVEKVGGRGVRPYQPDQIWEPVGFLGSNTRIYQRDNGEALYRRTLYTFIKRTAPAPILSNFDAPSREDFCGGRERSDTPLQALQLLNDVQFFESARALAQRVILEVGHDETVKEASIKRIFQLVLARLPERAEVETMEALLQHYLERYEADPKAAEEMLSNGELKRSGEIPFPILAAWTQLCSLILNLDETVSQP